MAKQISYTDEFKKQIVALYKNGKSVKTLVEEYGISKAAIYRWITNLNNSGSFKLKDNRTAEQNQILALQKENKHLKMENDILKQAALIIGRK